MNADDIETTLRARAMFDASVEHVDADTLRRLRGSRLQALQGGARADRMRWMWPAGMATAAVLALAVFIPYFPGGTIAPVGGTSHPVAALPSPASSPLDVAGNSGMAAGSAEAIDTADLETADPDLLSELDFYGWLAREQDNDNKDIGG